VSALKSNFQQGILEEEIKHARPSSKALVKSFERRRAGMKTEKARRDML